MILHTEQLQQLARETALTHSIAGTTTTKKTVKAFAADMVMLRQCGQYLVSHPSDTRETAEEWLLDHLDFLEEQAIALRAAMRVRASTRLPSLPDARPRIMDIAERYIDCVDGVFSADTWIVYLRAYQEVSVLTMQELWVAPYLLRIAIVRTLRVSMEAVRMRKETDGTIQAALASLPADQLSTESLRALLVAENVTFPVSGPVMMALVKYLRERAEDPEDVRTWLLCVLDSSQEQLDLIVTWEHQLQATLQVRTGHLITSLRSFHRLRARDLFVATSTVERLLCDKSPDWYSCLDDDSKHTVWHRVEWLAARFRVPESLVAEHAGILAEDYQANAVRTSPEGIDAEHPFGRGAYLGYYLLDPNGVKQLRQSLRACGQSMKRTGTHVWRKTDTQYVSLLGVTTALWLVIGIAALHFQTVSWAWLLAGIVALILPAMEWATTSVHFAIEFSTATRPLLRYDFSRGIPPEATTMVVMPVIWSTVQEVEHLVGQLELHYLANRDPNIHYAILADFCDATEASTAEDAVVLEASRTAIARLQSQYEGTTFHLYHRARTYNKVEKVWMGWERKRGKLVEFVEMMRGTHGTAFAIREGDASILPRVRYLITLDADTQMPLGVAQRMIGTMHNPYNRPRLNPTKTRVIEGYGILQPRIGIAYEAAVRTWLSKFWAGAPGIDPYAFAASDPYQDFAQQGIFTGKGIFDVDAFATTVCDRIADNRVLSHDLLEGGLLRAGLLSDIELLDGHPATLASHLRRQHRWVRGDWQLLDWLRRHNRNRAGQVVPVDLTVLTRYQMVDNLRRSLTAPVLLILLALGLTVLPGSAIGWTLVVLCTLALPVMRTVLSALRGWRWPSHIAPTFVQVITTALLLPLLTSVMLDAIGRTLFRVLITKRHLLQWVSAAEVERHGATSLPCLPGAIAIIVAFAAVVYGEAHGVGRVMGLTMAGIWGISLVLARVLDREISTPKPVLHEQQRVSLHELAADIWRFYAEYANASEHFLPPDNVQLNPPVGVAHRTSPTNIGMLLTSILAAHDLGLHADDDMLARLEATVDTIEHLDKWHGHLYNWYDTQSLAPLTPQYVSTVDSGNLVACYLVVQRGLQARADVVQDAALGVRMKSLCGRLERLMVQTDFRPLYDHKAQLFTLGYHVDTDTRETILYDLLASEARQASFMAIALGQISVSHWFALNRTMTKAGGTRKALLSWSGTVFEYMMPALFMRWYPGTIWDETYKAVTERQIGYAQSCHVPFGISESGYYAFDFQMNYQYRAFGVPGLGFKRGLGQDLVIAPYATLLCLPFAGDRALANIDRLKTLGAYGRYGLYEAIDFTKERMPAGQDHVIIESYMAHHQGMGLLAITNVLLDNIMVDRFHSDPRVRAAELLLQERMPERPAIVSGIAQAEHELPSIAQSQPTAVQEWATPLTPQPEACVLSNGSFLSIVSNAGGGFLRQGSIAVTRFREDAISDPWGSFVYIRNLATDALWAPTYLPVRVRGAQERIRFSPHAAEFSRRDGDVETCMEVCVAPEWNAEVRRITLTNLGATDVTLEVTTYMEVVLGQQAADMAHPAFHKLFVETSYDPSAECVLAKRRPRHPEDNVPWAAHGLFVEGDARGPVEYETDRARFIGRGRTLAHPAAVNCRLSETTGSVLDPIFSVRRRVDVPRGHSVQLFAVTTSGDSRAHVIQSVTSTRTAQQVQRTFDLAYTRTQIESSHLHVSAAQILQAYALASRALFSAPPSARREEWIRKNQRGQSGFWAHGISGDRPLMVVIIEDVADLAFVADVTRLHTLLRRRGFVWDLVLWNSSVGGYRQSVADAIRTEVERIAGVGLGGDAGLHVVTAEQLSPEDRVLLLAAARMTLRADGPSLRAQLRDQREHVPEVVDQEVGEVAATVRADTPCEPTEPEESPTSWALFNGWGGFAKGGREYRIYLKSHCNLPAPWTNVLANPHFGTIVTELGSGYSWWRNSRECKLTPWQNDATLERAPEACYLRDEESAAVWSPTPAPMREAEPYTIAHGYGYTRYMHDSHGIRQEMTISTSLHDPVKIVQVRLHNQTDRIRKLSVTYYAEWVLGVERTAQAPYLVTQWDAESRAILARNAYQDPNLRDAVAFLTIGSDKGGTAHSFTTDRREFIGRGRTVEDPAGMRRAVLSGAVTCGVEACGAVRQTCVLAAGEEVTVWILLGATTSQAQAQMLMAQYGAPEAGTIALSQVTQYWESVLTQMQVQTPSPEMNLLLNGWLLYQTLSCRIWARTASYQAGGAYGFRDQLQDALSLLHTKPDLVRAQILHHAAHQFEEGDVQHWWHEETARGIRTRFSDDLLWLPYAVSRYVEHTGDRLILEETVPYLHDAPLAQGEDERYGETKRADQAGTVWEHCVRAIARALQFGEHGLPLMGSGDWNDGLSLVGPRGKGESVWLGWFLCDILRRFEPLAASRNAQDIADAYQAARMTLTEHMNSAAWDGHWFRRAYTDDGIWLGSIDDKECRIDAIAQSWSVLSGAGEAQKASTAMQSFDRELVDRDLYIARLLTPPFNESTPSPGYIQGYPPGIRENGGQYTHGVIWAIIAWCQLGKGDEAFTLFDYVNPLTHARTPSEVATYAGEPYVMAADVYSEGPHRGRAGWTWYTGAAGWMYQAGIEWILGVQRRGDLLHIQPVLPTDWPSASVAYRYGHTQYDIQIQRVSKEPQPRVHIALVDGQTPVPASRDGQVATATAIAQAADDVPSIRLIDDGLTHTVMVELR